MNNKYKGFTLIELIIVIVILGILAVTAAPRFLNLATDARIATLQGMEATLKSGMNLVNSKAQIQGKTNGSASVTEGSVSIATYAGYPTGHWANSIRYVIELDDQNFTPANTVCTTEWCGLGNQKSSPTVSTLAGAGILVKIFPEGFTFEQECGVVYINRQDDTKPQIVLETNDC